MRARGRLGGAGLRGEGAAAAAAAAVVVSELFSSCCGRCVMDDAGGRWEVPGVACMGAAQPGNSRVEDLGERAPAAGCSPRLR